MDAKVKIHQGRPVRSVAVGNGDNELPDLAVNPGFFPDFASQADAWILTVFQESADGVPPALEGLDGTHTQQEPLLAVKGQGADTGAGVMVEHPLADRTWLAIGGCLRQGLLRS